jgi:3(or 17)beta-hydroxysteroid dehydrogenase
MRRVEGKVALITGGARGLGAADAIMLAREGARVIVTDVLDGSAIADQLGGLYLPQDVGDEARWIEVIDIIRTRYGRLDILVNNAGIMISGNAETTSLDDLRKVFAVAVEGTFLGIKHALPLLKEGDGGSIINLSSITAFRHFPDTLAYASAKGAIRSMTKSVAGYCKSKGYAVRCNSVHPSGIDTPMVHQRLEEAAQAKGLQVEALINSQQMGLPEDVANMVVFLASDESRYVNGTEMVIDDGYCAV